MQAAPAEVLAETSTVLSVAVTEGVFAPVANDPVLPEIITGLARAVRVD